MTRIKTNLGLDRTDQEALAQAARALIERAFTEAEDQDRLPKLLRSVHPTGAKGSGMGSHRLFATGGTGYLGSRLIPRLLDRGHHVTALIRQSSPSAAAGLRSGCWQPARYRDIHRIGSIARYLCATRRRPEAGALEGVSNQSD